MNKQNKIIVGVVALILALTIGYAVFTQSLNISGTAKAEGNLDIVFSEVGEISPHGTNTPTATITENGRKLELSEITLDYPTAYVDIPVTIINNGTVDGILESITVENLETDDIKISINGIENNQIVKIYKANDDTTKVKATVRVEWLDKTDTKTESVKDIVVTLNAKQLVKEAVTTTSSSSDSFPVLTGSLGDNVTFTYDNGNISIDGTGPMSAGTVVSGGYCDGYQVEGNICSLQAELSMALNGKLSTGDETADTYLGPLVSEFIVGHTYETMGNSSKEEFKAMLVSEEGLGVSETAANKLIEIADSVPKLKNITISNGITSIRPKLFWSFNASNLTITFPNTISAKSNKVFDAAKIGTITFESGTKIIYEGINETVDGAIDNIILPDGIETIETHSIYVDGGTMTTLIIPSTVTTIETRAIDGQNLTTIVNKTGKAFDWNGILTSTSGTAFETGTVNDGSRIITITNK